MSNYRLTKVAEGKVSKRLNNRIANPEVIEDTTISPSRPRIGYKFIIGNYKTATVTSEMDKNGEFRTKNATYKFEKI